VTQGLKTTSAKIRALANADYDRTEISQHLGIVYQHVRKVLLDAGITNGLRRKVPSASESVVIDAAQAATEDKSYDVLLRGGFQIVGEWTQDPGGSIGLNARVPAESGVYAFVIDDSVMYVGLTNGSLKACLDQYRRGHEGQRTRSRVKKLIAKTLSEGQRVKVMAATPEPLEWRGLPVNGAAGLEAGLIRMFRPAWNITGTV
jgi:hypothetical protein